MAITTFPVSYTDGNVLSASDLTQNFNALNTATVPAANGGTGLASYAVGDLLYASATTTLSKLAAGAANRIVGMNSAATAPEHKALTDGGGVGIVHAANSVTLTADWVLAGSNTTEATTTATSLTDLVTVSSLSITAGTPFVVIFSYRKSAGAAAASLVGLKVNATTMSTAGITFTNADNAASFGNGHLFVPGYDANYARVSGWGTVSTGATSIFGFQGDGSDRPNATVTSITVQGLSGNAAVTTGIKNVYVYTLAVA